MEVDQPLDAIIQSNKKSGRGGRGRGRGRGRGGGQFRRASGQFRRTSTGGGRGRGFRGGRQSNRFQSRQMENKWQHDMYQGSGFNGVAQAQTPARSGSGSKLLISNLDYGVSDDDIMELFREFGRLKKAEVHYDKSGRSMGTAQVIFERQVDAMKAVKQYNGVPLDGRPMSIQIMDGGQGTKSFTSTPNKGTVRQRVGVRQSNGAGTRGGGRGRGRGRGRRGGGRGAKQAPPTAEELDADLDAYKQSTDTWET